MSYEICLERYDSNPEGFRDWLVDKIKQDKLDCIKYLEQSIESKKGLIEDLKEDLDEQNRKEREKPST